MTFTIEKLPLTDERGIFVWRDGPKPAFCCDIVGEDATAALTLVVAKDGGVLVGVSASYVDGQAVMVVEKGRTLYALRAVPWSDARSSLVHRELSPPFAG